MVMELTFLVMWVSNAVIWLGNVPSRHVNRRKEMSVVCWSAQACQASVSILTAVLWSFDVFRFLTPGRGIVFVQRQPSWSRCHLSLKIIHVAKWLTKSKSNDRMMLRFDWFFSNIYVVYFMVRLIYSRSGITAARVQHPDHGRAVEAINTSVNVVKGNRADVLSHVV